MLHLATFSLLSAATVAVKTIPNKAIEAAKHVHNAYINWRKQVKQSQDHLHYIREQARDEAVDLHHF